MKVTDPMSNDEYYKALCDRDENYLDVFYAGVKTTGIFCVPTCRARKPKKENVDFYHSLQNVLRAGFRPCKVCKPTTNRNEIPEFIQKAIALLKDSKSSKVNDQSLREHDLDPSQIRRWFTKHHNITFQTYQRMLRVNGAFNELVSGKSIADSALDNGFSSLSGFGYTFKKYTGLTPDQARNKNVLLINKYETPIGPMFVCASDDGICLLEFTDRRMLETEMEDLQKRFDAIILYGENTHIKQLKIELNEYFSGDRKEFNVALDTPSTPFRVQVWEKLKEVDFGATVSYKEQAIKLGNSSAVRAVANANGHNRVAIVIPCHRVIGSDGSLTGYAGGLDRKRWLLNHEGALEDDIQLSLF